jgi:exosortase/archaeosortase family protein
VAWSLGLFGLFRLSWFEAHFVVPLTNAQALMAERALGAAVRPIEVTLACSGSDVLALCVGALLAYPVPWTRRLSGAAGGIALVLALNTLRIGTLGRAAGSSSFDLLHLWVWPALLTLATAGYVFAWMRYAERRPAAPRESVATGVTAGALEARPPRPAVRRAETSLLTRRFGVWTAVLLGAFTVASPLYLTSPTVLAVAAFTARAAAIVLAALGIPAIADANILSTGRGAFLVTQECIATPLVPVYLAAVVAYARTWRQRSLALLALGPLFATLGIARLLVVALPPALVRSPLFLVHAFYQLLLGGVVVLLAAAWRHGLNARAGQRALLGVVLGGLVAYLLAPPLAHALASAFPARLLPDPQGAIAFLPPFQVGLYVGLCLTAFAALSWRAFATGLALLGTSQIALVAVLHYVAEHVGLQPQVRDVRAWAVAGPLLVVAAVVRREG